jgi:hypothetical protein
VSVRSWNAYLIVLTGGFPMIRAGTILADLIVAAILPAVIAGEPGSQC